MSDQGQKEEGRGTKDEGGAPILDKDCESACFVPFPNCLQISFTSVLPFGSSLDGYLIPRDRVDRIEGFRTDAGERNSVGVAQFEKGKWLIMPHDLNELYEDAATIDEAAAQLKSLGAIEIVATAHFELPDPAGTCTIEPAGQSGPAKAVPG
jgi:hypothetical protein